jgi:putative transposase
MAHEDSFPSPSKETTLQELAAAYGVHPVQIAPWKKMALEELPKLLSSRRSTKQKAEDALKAALSQQIGQLKVELDWLKKKLALPVEAKRALLEPAHLQLNLRRQCALLGVARSGVYDHSVGDRAEDLQLMRLLDAQYTETPFDGVRRMTAWLCSQGYGVNHKRVGRLMHQMGLEAIYPKPRLSQPTTGHERYPYLLRGVTVDRVNHVWSADITSIRLAAGLVYLVAVIDWFSRDWAVLGSIDHHGWAVLCGGAGPGAASRATKDFSEVPT